MHVINGRLRIRELCVDGGQDTAVHGHEVRVEGQRDRAFRDEGELLFDFRSVAVRAEAVGLERVVHLAEEGADLGLAA